MSTPHDPTPPPADPGPTPEGSPPTGPPSGDPPYGGPPPGGPPPGGAQPGAPGPAPRKGLSTGAKVAIGCGGLFLVVMILVVALLGVGGLFLKDRADRFVAGVERQGEVTERMAQLQRDYPFDPPADGVVTERQARTFMAVTNEAWRDIEPWANDMAELSRRMDERDRPRIADMASGVRGMGRFVESRTVLADALVDNRMTIGEYLWTGLTLLRAHEELDRERPSEGVPQANLALARAHRAELDEIAQSGDGQPDRGVVLQVAILWGMADGSTWQAIGLDTLQHYAR